MAQCRDVGLGRERKDTNLETHLVAKVTGPDHREREDLKTIGAPVTGNKVMPLKITKQRKSCPPVLLCLGSSALYKWEHRTRKWV